MINVPNKSAPILPPYNSLGQNLSKYSIYEIQKMPQDYYLSTHSSVGQNLSKYYIYEKQKNAPK